MLKRQVKHFIKNWIPYGLIDKHTESVQTIIDTTGIAPVVYNETGEPMQFFYLQDNVSTHNPYSFGAPGMVSKYIIWDRYNSGLPIHFYSHDEVFRSKKNVVKKFGIFLESESIVPGYYEQLLEEKSIAKEYIGIFTHSERVLNQYENAYFAPGGSVWYGTLVCGGKLREDAYELKNKNVSLVSSNKTMCKLHQYRKDLAMYYKTNGLVDTFGTFDGGKNIQIADSLTDYRYSIVIENMITSYFFTEKLMNCFASMTVPIYIGASKVGEFFNEDGIIRINPIDFGELDHIINKCGVEDYKERQAAIIDNYHRVLSYQCYEDYLYYNYKELF